MIIIFFPFLLFALTIQNVSNKEFNITKYEKIKILNSKNITLNFIKKFKGKINLFNFIQIKNSKNVYINNLHINSSNFYNSVIYVKKIDKNNKFLFFDTTKEEKINLDKNLKNSKYIKIIYLAKLYKNRISRKFSKVNQIEKNKIYYNKFPFTKLGKYVLIFRYKIPVVNIYKSENVYINNFTLNSSPGIIFLIRNIKNIYFNNVKVKDTFNRKITSNADIFHCPNIRGDFVLKNSYFEYVSDDIVNIYSKALDIECNSGKCELNKKYDLKKGDKLYFYDIKNAKLEIATINKIKGDKIFLNNKLNTSKNIQVYLENKVNVLIKNNIFKNSRRFGILIRNYGSTVIKNNTFENLSGDAITFFNSPKNREGLFSKNILIENNIIKNVALGKKSKAAISIYALKKNWQKVKYTKNFFKNIQIKNNKIENSKFFFIQNSQSINLNN